LRLRRFVFQIHQFGRGRLHAKGQLIGIDAGGEFIVAVARRQVLAIERLNQVQRAALLRAADLRLRAKIENRRLARPHRHALISRGQKAIAPRRRAAFDFAAGIGQHNVGGQIAVFAPQAISDPTPRAGPTHEDAAGIHLIDRLRMVHAIAVQRANHAQLVGQFGDVRQELTHRDGRLAARFELLHRLEQRILHHVAPRHDFAELLRQRLARVLDEVGLGVEQIDVAGPAVHEQPDDPLRPRRKVRLPRASRGGVVGQ
jgi:hypothetical protein